MASRSSNMSRAVLLCISVTAVVYMAELCTARARQEEGQRECIHNDKYGRGAGNGGELLVLPLPKDVRYGKSSARVSESGIIVTILDAYNDGWEPREAMSRVHSAGALVEKRLARLGSLKSFPRNPKCKLDIRSFALITELVVTVSRPRDYEDVACGRLGLDPRVEAYSLSIENNGTASLVAPCSFGLLRGLASFEQIITSATHLGDGIHIVHNLPLTINDIPRFAYRGVLLDIARHFYSLSGIFRVLDSMRHAKLNILHLHAVDAQSFPLEITKQPLLSKCGSYNEDAVYSRQDVRSIVQYAASHGIRVLFEIDVPGHSASWGKCLTNLTLDCPEFSTNVNDVALDVTSNSQVIDVVNDVVQQVISDSSVVGIDEQWIHLGGDEISLGCLRTSRQYREMLVHNPHISPNEILNSFENSLMDRLREKQDPLMTSTFLWDDVLEWFNFKNFDTKSFVINAWQSDSSIRKALDRGFKSILSFPWYLDKTIYNCTAHKQTCDTSAWAWMQQWEEIYLADPEKFAITQHDQINRHGELTKSELILGGQASSWSEFIDEDVIDAYLWPRTAGVAERLWSSASTRNLTSAGTRIRNFVCFLKRNGIKSGPLGPSPPCILS